MSASAPAVLFLDGRSLDDAGHLFTFRRSRTGRPLHSAACACWKTSVVETCRYCRREHTAGPCRWARWLGRG